MPYDWSTALPGVPWTSELPGVFSRHDDGCPVRFGGPCTCGPLGYFATVVDPVTNRQVVSPPFAAVGDAQQWQIAESLSLTATADRRSREAQPPEHAAAEPSEASGGKDLGAVIEEFLEAAQDGHFHDDDGDSYTRERLRDLRGALSYAAAELGTLKLQDVRRRNVQSLVDQLRAAGVDGDRVTSVVDALRLVYSYAIQRGLVDYTPVVELVLPGADNGNGPHGTDTYTQGIAAQGGTTGPPFPGQAGYANPPAYPPPSGYATSAGYPAPVVYPTTPGYPTPPGYPAPPGYSTPPGFPTSPPYPTPGMPAAGSPTPFGFHPPPGFSTSQGMPVVNAPGSGVVGALAGGPAPGGGDAFDATQQERFLWWTVRIVVIVFVLIALVLAAESI